MLESHTNLHSVTPDDTLAYVPLNARRHEGMTFDESLGAPANYLELPTQPRLSAPKRKSAAGSGRSLTERSGRGC
jgi:hypothetical protein